METKWVGQALERTEDHRLITKGDHFIDDLTLPGVAHAAHVRSLHARAKIRHIDVRRALDHPGVYAVITGEEVAQLTRPQRGRVPLANSPKVYALAYQQVRYVGEPMVGIAAVDRATAEDAADLIEVEYDPLPPVLDPEQALRPDAPLVFEEVGSNILWHDTFPYGDVEGAFKEADTVVDERVTIHRYCSTPLETFGVMAQYEAATQSYTIWGHTQQPAQDLHVLAATLGISLGKIRVIVPPMGGSFGNKVRPLFIIAAALLARKAGRPVKWIEDRRENLMACNHSREQRHRVRAAVDDRGRILAIDDEFFHDQGAYVRTHGARVADMTAGMLPGPYRVPAYRAVGHYRLTNKTPAATYRAPGRYEATFVCERLLDAIAAKIGIDRVEVRRRNLIAKTEMPYARDLDVIDTEVVLDSGDYAGLLDQALARADWAALQSDLARRRAAGEAVGAGLAFFVEKSGLGPVDGARVSMAADGTFDVVTGAASLGQGVETVLAQIAADALGVDYRRVRVVHGHTDRIEQGYGSHASRTTVMTGSAVHIAATKLRENMQPGCSAQGSFKSEHMTYPYGVHVAVVKVDRETGGVEIERYLAAFDIGRAVNPRLVEGQIEGGVVQGLGGALLEEFVYDAQGSPLSVTFADYTMPTACEAPGIAVLRTEDAPSPLNPRSIKGAGESGVNPVGAVIASAIDDALGVPGAVTRLPVTPPRLVEIVRAERR